MSVISGGDVMDAMVNLGKEEKDNLAAAAERQLEIAEQGLSSVGSVVGSVGTSIAGTARAGATAAGSSILNAGSGVLETLHLQRPEAQAVVVVSVRCPGASAPPRPTRAAPAAPRRRGRH